MATSPTPAAVEPDRGPQVVKILVGLALLVVLAFLAAAFLPRWWSHRIGHQVDGSITRGIILGLFYGFLFTALPLLAARWVFHKRRPWKTWGILGLLTLVLATPNLLTLGIVIGSGHAAHAGERTLDVDAPGFRGSTLAGALVALFLGVFVEYLIRARRRSERRLEEARDRLRARDQDDPTGSGTR